MMHSMTKSFLPFFDTLKNINEIDLSLYKDKLINSKDLEKALAFLKLYNGSQATFNAYRRELERLLRLSPLFQKVFKNAAARRYRAIYSVLYKTTQTLDWD